MTNIPVVKLNNNVLMPQFGFGVYQAQEGVEVESAVTAAINAGYRLIDTAAVYGNEVGVGNAIRSNDVPREELFVTTKLWNSDQGYDAALKAFDTSLEKLGLDYVDLYLIHWPSPKRGLFVETWRALEEIYKQGRAKAIGVSNFQPHHLDELLENATVVPAVNQIELHPHFNQKEVRDYCGEYNIIVESWSPIGGGGGKLLEESVFIEIGQKYGKSPAQVVIRWHLQNNLIVIPKSVHQDRIEQNIDVFDFELSSEDMASINGLEKGQRVGSDPDTADF